MKNVEFHVGDTVLYAEKGPDGVIEKLSDLHVIESIEGNVIALEGWDPTFTKGGSSHSRLHPGYIMPATRYDLVANYKQDADREVARAINAFSGYDFPQYALKVRVAVARKAIRKLREAMEKMDTGEGYGGVAVLTYDGTYGNTEWDRYALYGKATFQALEYVKEILSPTSFAGYDEVLPVLMKTEEALFTFENFLDTKINELQAPRDEKQEPARLSGDDTF